jgi:hypothetical protein
VVAAVLAVVGSEFMSGKRRSGAGNPLPGFGAGLTVTVAWLGVLLLIPVLACVAKAGTLSWPQFVSAVWSARARSAYLLTFGASAVAAVLDLFLGTLLAWVLVRYRFPGRRLMDAVIDLPLALPTAVAGLVYSGLYVRTGWLGQYLVPLGIEGAYSKLAIVLVLTFLGLPFVVRTVQPLLGSGLAGCRSSGHISVGFVAGIEAGHGDGWGAGFCAWSWRVRIGGICIGEHAAAYGDCSCADRAEAGGVCDGGGNGDRVCAAGCFDGVFGFDQLAGQQEAALCTLVVCRGAGMFAVCERRRIRCGCGFC